jgi:hypothetical protein
LNNWIFGGIYYYNGSDFGGTFATEYIPTVLSPYLGYYLYVRDDSELITYKLIITKPTQ